MRINQVWTKASRPEWALKLIEISSIRQSHHTFYEEDLTDRLLVNQAKSIATWLDSICLSRNIPRRLCPDCWLKFIEEAKE